MAQIRVGLDLLLRVAVNARDMPPGERCSPGQPDRAVAIGSANFKEARALAAAHQDVEELRGLRFQIEHFFVALLLLGIVVLPCGV